MIDINTYITTPVAVFAGSNQTSPAIFDDWIVWQDDRNGNWDIYVYRISSGATQQLTINGANQETPSVHGGNIVWQDFQTGDYDVWLYNISSLISAPIAIEAGNDETHPSVFNSRVVWEALNLTNFNREIWMDDVSDPNLPFIVGTDPGWMDLTEPFIFGDYVVWMDFRSGIKTNIYAYQISTATSDIPISINNAIEQSAPKTFGDKIVWQGVMGAGWEDIFMNTLNINEPCLAEYTGPTFAARNQPVTFTNTSTGWQTNWSWNFGDGGLAYTPDPAHTFMSSGTFPVTLTVNNPYCRNMTSLIPSRYVSVDSAPVAAFTTNTTTGMVPLIVQFTNRSTGWQNAYLWDFGDGNTSVAANPLFTYRIKGTYPVSLTTSNDYGGDPETKTAYIHALGGSREVQNAAISGITITTVSGRPYLDFDTTQLTDYQFNPANNSVILCIPPASSGFQQLSFYSLDGTGFTQTGGTISGTLSRTSLMSNLMQPTGFSASLGTPVTVNYTLDYPGYPSSATITTNIYDDTVPDNPDFDLVARGSHFSSILGMPYVIQFQKTGLGSGYLATLNMSVNSSWITNHGGSDHLFTIRLGDDYYGQVLPTRRVSQEPANNIDNLGIVSPNGLSRFAPAGLSGSGNVFQMAYFGAVEHFGGNPSPADSGGAGPGGGKSSGQGLQSQQNQPILNPPPAYPAAPAAKTADLYINDKGVVTQTTVLEATDRLATISIGQGVTAFDANGNPLSSVSIETLTADHIALMPSPGMLSFAGLAYNFQPDGATFSPAVTITFTVPNAQWGQQYTAREFDVKAGSWVDLPTTYHPETGTISASVSHFCCIALFTSALPSNAAETAVKTMPAKPDAIPTPAPSSPLGFFYNMIFFIADLAVRNLYLVLVLIAIIAAFYLKGRRGRLDKIRYNTK